MQEKNTKLDFSGQEIFVGLDTGKKSWKISILTEELEHKTFTQPPKPEALVGYLREHFVFGNISSFGYCVERRLDSSG